MESRPDLLQELRGVTPPNSIEAERSVLGAMLQDPNAVMQAAETLTAEDFYQPQHRELFDAMMKLFREQTPVDLVTADSELSRRGTLEGVGGTAYLIELSRSVPSAVNARAYIQIVDEKSTLRKLIAASEKITQACYAGDRETQEVLEEAEKLIYDITMR